MTEIARYPSLRGRTVLVTGGGSGIGAAIVRHFAGQGARVGFLDIDVAASTALVAELVAEFGPTAVQFEPCDLRDIPALRAAIAAVAAALGPITILVNNAAHDARHQLEDVTPDYWDERYAVNLRHQFFAAQAVAPGMTAAGGGSSSTSARIPGCRPAAACPPTLRPSRPWSASPARSPATSARRASASSPSCPAGS